jgi:transposase InsO family protein
MVAFVDAHRAAYGIEPICRQLLIAPSTYYRHAKQHADPTARSARAQRDDELRAAIQRVWDANLQVYGPRKVWQQLRRDGIAVARCTVQRLMRAMGLVGAVRGGLDDDHGAAHHGHTSAGSRRADVYGAAAQSALGLGFHLRRDVARLCVRRLRD